MSSRPEAPAIPGGLRVAPPFVGRVAELAWLVRVLEAAIAGRPQVALVVGEAGIGKTRLLRELCALAGERGVEVCAGRGYEDLRVPLLPALEAFSGRLRDLPYAAEAALGRDADLVRALVGPSGVALPQEAAHPDAGEQLRSILAVSRAVLAFAGLRPTLFLLDDLHWVDQPSIELFSQLVFAAADRAEREALPLLIVGSLRPVARDDRVARAVARFQRETICQTLELAGLSEDEVSELVSALGLRRPAHQVVAAVNQTTRGNPLFVEEVVHHLLRSAAVDRESGSVASAVAPLDLRLPADLTAAVAARVHELGEPCRALLTLAAFVGDAVALRTLAAVAGSSEESLLEQLDDAFRAGLVQLDGATLHFAHPLVRHALYAEPTPAARQGLHARVAEALSALDAGSSSDHLLEIAHHLIAAGALAEPARVLECARKAGDRAYGKAAFCDAARFYRAALAIGESRDLLPAHERARLHYLAGLAHYRDQDAGPCLDQYERAIAIFEQTGDLAGLARALMGRTRARFTLASVGYGELIDPAPLEDVRVRLAESDPGLAGFVAAELAQVFWTARRSAEAEAMASAALAAGERLGDDLLAAEAHRALALVCAQTMRPAGTLSHLELGLARARRARDRWIESQIAQRIPLALVWLGRLDEAEQVARQGADLTRDLHDWGDHSLAQGALVCSALARGDFAASERHAHQAMIMLQRSSYPWAGLTVLPALACARALRGSFAEAEDALATLVEPGKVFEDPGPPAQIATHLMRELVRAWASSDEHAHAEVRDRLLAFPRQAIAADDAADVYGLGVFGALAELACVARLPSHAEAAAEILRRGAESGAVFSSGWVCLLARVVGSAACLGRDWEQAEAWLGRAIEQARERDARPELARSYLGLARMLVERGQRGDRRRAAELLARAIPIARDLGMAPCLHEASRLAARTNTRVAAAPGRRRVLAEGTGEREVTILLGLARGRTTGEIARDLVLAPETVGRLLRELGRKSGVHTAADAAEYLRSHGLVKPGDLPEALPQQHGTLRTILFTDVEGSTALFERLGDLEARAVLRRRHDDVVRDCLARAGGVEVKHTGDGIMAWFSAVSPALDCAIAIQRAIALPEADERAPRIRARIGINAGEPLHENGDLHGAAVILAARLCARARPGQVLVSEVVRSLARGKDVSFIDRGRMALHGFSDRVRVFEVPWRSNA